MTNSRPNIPRQRAILDPVDVMLSGLGDHEVTVPRRPRAGLVTHGKATDAAQNHTGSAEISLAGIYQCTRYPMTESGVI
jgi:hypothetical protein